MFTVNDGDQTQAGVVINLKFCREGSDQIYIQRDTELIVQYNGAEARDIGLKQLKSSSGQSIYLKFANKCEKSV
jgi:hypothetical protein